MQHEKQHRQLQTQAYKAASLGDENTQERPDRGGQEDQDCRQFQTVIKLFGIAGFMTDVARDERADLREYNVPAHSASLPTNLSVQRGHLLDLSTNVR